MPREVVIDLRHTQVQEQPAVDPNLCLWAEWYFLALLVKLFREQCASQAARDAMIKAHIHTDQGVEVTSLLQKGWLTGVEYPGIWSGKRNFRQGQPTALVLSGSLEDMIMIPEGDSFVVGRRLGPGFNPEAMSERVQWAVSRSDEYRLAEHALVTSALNAGETYAQLFKRVKTRLVEEALRGQGQPVRAITT